MRIGINCGHTLSRYPGCGAIGYLNESNETRAIGYPLMEMLRQLGHTVIDCTNDKASSATENLNNICRLANAQPLDLFVSIHLNAGGGLGTEVYTKGAKDIAYAGRIKNSLSNLGFRDRGIKDGSHLYVLKNTKAQSVLIEVCFVDTWEDSEMYARLGAVTIAQAICKAITGTTPNQETEELTLTQYEELKTLLSNIDERLKKIENPMVYNYIDSNMPDWAIPTVTKLVNKGVLKGDGDGLDLTEELMRVLVINDRAGIYD